MLPGGSENFKTLAITPSEEASAMQQRVIISKAVDHIANGLFCMFQSLGVAPPILLMKENDVLQQKIC